MIFHSEWCKEGQFGGRLVQIDRNKGKCITCNRELNVSYNGKRVLENHFNSENHKKMCQKTSKTKPMDNFITIGITPSEEQKVSTAEICLTYHNVYHHHSYRSMDCNVNLNQLIFSDSKVCKAMKCGRTKAEAIVVNVLAPFSVEKHLNELSDKKFSVSYDASNKGNIKLFPLAIKYFNKEQGIDNFLLDFYDDANETSSGIYNRIKSILNENKLETNNLVSYCADNVSVNYGKNNSVFQKFAENDNSFILKANCNCHIIRNAAKFGMKKLPFDIENLVLKINAHFSCSAKRLNYLKQYYETSDDYGKLLKHVPIRWLSLFPAIDKLIENIEPIFKYFREEEKDDDLDIIICKSIEINTKSENLVTLPELYLYFTHQYMRIFYETILLLEKNSLNSTHL
jgi:hypothetical protein